MHHNAIKIENLSYTYPDRTKALDDISLEVEAGESVGIIGPNGAGKSTLLLNLNGILGGDGKLNVCGIDVKNGNKKKVRSQVGIVFQDPNDQLFMPTVFDDIAFGPLNLDIPKERIKEMVSTSLAQVELTGFEERQTHHLSLGEKKRVSIATVLSMNPSILALDEPVMSLDPRSRRKLINTLSSLNITKIIVTHDLDLVEKLCDRLVIMNNGKIIAQGTTSEIINNNNLLKENGLQ